MHLTLKETRLSSVLLALGAGCFCTEILSAFQDRPLMATPAAAATGQVQGKVITDIGGAPISGVAVTAIRLSSGPGVATNATTGKDGSFTLSNLPSGQFGICVANTGGLVDPCTWPHVLTRVEVTDGKTSSAVTVRIHSSSTLKVRVNDAGQNLGKKAADPAPSQVVVGAFDMTGAFHPGLEVKKDGSGVDFEVIIPQDTPVRLTVFTNQVMLEDDKHTPVPAQGFQQMVVQASSDKQPKQFTFNVLGRK